MQPVLPMRPGLPERRTHDYRPLATCSDSAIRLLGRDAGIHGAIVADTLQPAAA